jgi:hypothetical protein
MKAMANPNVSTVSCPCGATMEVDLGSGEEVLFCSECRETLQLAISVDPVTKKKRVGVVLSMGALLSQKDRKGEEKGGVHKAKCTCGAMIFVDPQAVDSVHTCGKCGAGFSAVLKRGKTPGLSTLVLRPMQAAPVAKASKPASAGKLPSFKGPKPASAPAKTATPASSGAAGKPKPVPAAFDAAATPAREQLITFHKGDMGAQAIQVREEGSFIACFCGKEIKLKGEASREVHKCGDCSTAYRLFYAFDPRTKSPMVVMLPRSATK